MVDVFEKYICSCCKTTQCDHKIIIENINKKITICKCEQYIKDKRKIIPYVQPLIVTAERDYVNKKEK